MYLCFLPARKASVALVDTISCCWNLFLLCLRTLLPSSWVLWGHGPQFGSLMDPRVRLRVGSLCTGMLLGVGCQRRTLSYQMIAHLVPL